ncbi:MAG: hypothetical protein HUJ57_06275 [Erysipelotrichaceae bacterium]|nr:hypothetical protein [Erysipelotrichaceae bacterium]
MKKILIVLLSLFLIGCVPESEPVATVEPEVTVEPEATPETVAEEHNGPYADSTLHITDIDKLIGMKRNPECTTAYDRDECNATEGLEDVPGLPEDTKVEDKGVIDGYHHFVFSNGLISIEIGLINEVYDMEMSDQSYVALSEGGYGMNFGIFFTYDENVINDPEGKYDAKQYLEQVGGPYLTRKHYWITADKDWLEGRELIEEVDGYMLLKEETWFDGDQAGIDYLKGLDMVKLIKVEKLTDN